LTGFIHYLRVGPNETRESDEVAAREMAKKLEQAP
jgi:hypothetical protein